MAEMGYADDDPSDWYVGPSDHPAKRYGRRGSRNGDDLPPTDYDYLMELVVREHRARAEEIVSSVPDSWRGRLLDVVVGDMEEEELDNHSSRYFWINDHLFRVPYEHQMSARDWLDLDDDLSSELHIVT